MVVCSKCNRDMSKFFAILGKEVVEGKEYLCPICTLEERRKGPRRHRKDLMPAVEPVVEETTSEESAQ